MEALQTDEKGAEEVLAARGYRITKVLGGGGFGVVYAAERVRDGLEVAIKVAHRDRLDAAESLLREAAALDVIGAPHVPVLYEHGTVLRLTYAVLEYIAAPTLADQLVAAAGPMPLGTFATLAEAILLGVAAIHARGLVHCDLKPENIFVMENGRARIIDFGLVRHVKSQPSIVEVTGAANEVGTAEYMSPEQCDGLCDADGRSDIYSLGALFYEMLTGAPPFWGNAAEVREAHRSRRPAPLRSKLRCPPELDEAVRRCLAKDRAKRFQDIPSLAQALRTTAPNSQPPRKLSLAPAASSLARAPGAPAPRGPALVREKHTMGLVFFESDAHLSAVQAMATTSGGQIVQTDGAQYVAAFGHDVGDNPARIALVAAQRMQAANLSLRLCVDVATVSVQIRPDGSRRIFSALFSKKECFPTASDPPGVVLTRAASDVIPDLNLLPVPGRPSWFAIETVHRGAESTSIHLHTALFVGREETLVALEASARRASLESQPSIVTVVGEAGFGRTHLANVAAQRLEQSSVEVFRLKAQEAIVGAVSQILPDLLRRVLQLPDSAPSDGGRALLIEKLGKVGEQVWAGAALILRWVEAEHPDVSRLAAAPGALRLAAVRAVGEALRRRSATRALCILLDDAHLADDATLDALEFATLKEARARVWVCALVRPTFAHARPTWATRAAHAQWLTLEPLEMSQSIELARRLLYPVEYVPPQVLTRLAERTKGIPRLLVELVRGLKRDGFVRRSERGTGYYLATDELDKVPDLPIVQWNATREVSALPPQLAGHARLCSVLGESFTVSEVDGLLASLEREEVPEDMQLDASVGVQRLCDAGLLVRHRGGVIAFRHALLRETVYRLVPEAQQKKLHRAAFDMYRTLAMPPERRLPRLALHAARSGEKSVAASAYLELARSLEGHAYLEAEGAYGGALENLAEEDHAQLIAAARGRGLMRFRLSRHVDALKDLRLARERAEALGRTESRIELILDEAIVLDWAREWTQSAALVRSVQDTDAEISELLKLKLAMSLARVHHRLGESDACVRLGADVAERARSLGDDAYETRVIALLMVAPDCANLGRLDEAEQFFQAAISAAEAHSDVHHLGAAYLNRVLLWFARKDSERLFEDLQRSVQIGREIGSVLHEYTALYNMGEVEYALDRLADAKEHTLRALELARQHYGEANREVSGRELLLARIALYGGDLVEARELTARIRARAAAAHGSELVELELLPSDQVLLEMVELGSRVEAASEREWEAFTERCSCAGLQPLEEVECLELRALASARAGRLEESRSHFKQALAVSEAKPNLLSERVVRKYSQQFAA